MNKNFSQKCAIASQFIPFIDREDFRKQFIQKTKEEELSEECREFLKICCDKEDRFYKELDNGRVPSELKKIFKKLNY